MLEQHSVNGGGTAARWEVAAEDLIFGSSCRKKDREQKEQEIFFRVARIFFSSIICFTRCLEPVRVSVTPIRDPAVLSRTRSPTMASRLTRLVRRPAAVLTLLRPCRHARSFSHHIFPGSVVEAVVPFMGESITDGTLATFLKKPGDRVAVDEPIAQIETDKVTIDVVSPEAGIIEKFVAKEGDTVTPGTKVALISKETSKVVVETKEKPKVQSPPPPRTSASEPQLPPKERETRVPMPRLRKQCDKVEGFLKTRLQCLPRLMKLIYYKDSFLEKHGTKMGLMSGFVKAAVSGLQNQPIVNAVIDGEDIIYRDYIDISIAVGTAKGLVVPVLRDADKMGFADIEKNINNLAKRASEGTISIDEMAGGTFTISNGGVYGSLLSTPIINPPQSAILGMHSIVSRPVVVDGNVVPRPMMYIALTYDHRLIDGREAVYFLRRIKDVVEDPRRLLLDL
ncbi:hypothetical protein HPP92_028088 [Vanilla planifolia]|uniref:Dihydrolipoamide acetyltransferase component of pyruvate dehydrogenase complex n=1 Tax=Vanilla planifolia TaxID=51239 RepID=A0A835P9D0_VANPL|nr:hypothetical protein HPP92_028088 [Vanilla planifolia]KAG0447990.1 hypothetical protein HPP92_028065 [Vanilla planifolia]